MTILRTDKVAGPGGTNAIDGSVYFQGYVDGVASDYLKIPDSDDLDMGTGDFTFECWARGVEHTGSGDRAMGIFSSGAFTAGGLLVQNKNNGPLRVVIPLAAGGSFDESGSTNLWYGNWHHIAVVKTSNTIKAFINGVQEISATHSVGVDFAHGGYGTVGENCYVTYPGDYPYRGYISNLRLIKGSALYTANFTPPTSKLTAVDGTVLLCCQDSDDPTQEATGKTITGYGNLASVGANDNLVTNGHFTTGTTGWDDSLEPDATTLSSENQRLKIVASGGTGRARQVITGLTIGNRYKFQVRHVTCASGNCFTHLGTSDGGSEVAQNLGLGDEDLHTVYFNATTTTLYIQIGITIGLTGYFDDVSLTLAEQPKAPKVLPSVGTDAGTVLEGGVTFDSLNYMTLPKGTTAQRVNSRGRAVIPGGYNPAGSPNAAKSLNTIEYIEINTTANAVDFGDLSYGSASGGTCSSSTRAVTGGGYVAPSYGDNTNSMSYFTIASTGNGTNFGDLTIGRGYVASLSSDTRGIWAGGAGGPSSPFIQSDVSVTDYVTIASDGVDASDFGQLIDPGYMGDTACSSPTRGVIAGGSPTTNVIQYVTIASTGVAKDFGDLIAASTAPGAASSHTRGIFCGSSPGAPAYTSLNHIDYVTIATTGNAKDFGDSLYVGSYKTGTSNSVRAVWTGTYQTPANLNTIEYAQIQTLGNTVDFGDSTNSYGNRAGATSDTHGGLA